MKPAILLVLAGLGSLRLHPGRHQCRRRCCCRRNLRRRRRAASSAGRPQGVITGAAIGSVSGAIIAANNTRPQGWCTWRDRYTGQEFYARCP